MEEGEEEQEGEEEEEDGQQLTSQIQFSLPLFFIVDALSARFDDRVVCDARIFLLKLCF